jgi:hypothetical protein
LINWLCKSSESHLLVLNRKVLINKFFDREITSSNAYLKESLFKFDVGFLGTKLVQTLRLSNKKRFESGSLRVGIDEPGKLDID